MNDSHTPPWGHFYTSGNGNPQGPPSNFPREIRVSSGDELFFQNLDTTVEQQWRDTDGANVARQSSSAFPAFPPNHAATSWVSRTIQGSSYTGPQTTLNFHSNHLPSDMVIMIQRPYRSGLPLDYLRTIPPISYGGFNLQNAFAEHFGDLQNSDQLAWADDISLPPKLAIVLWFPGYPRYKHQATVLRAHRQPPTRGSLARIMAREMNRLLEKARTEYRRPLCWQGQELSLADFFLIDIEQVSKGSLQPRIGIRGDMGRPGSELVHRT